MIPPVVIENSKAVVRFFVTERASIQPVTQIVCRAVRSLFYGVPRECRDQWSYGFTYVTV